MGRPRIAAVTVVLAIVRTTFAGGPDMGANAAAPLIPPVSMRSTNQRGAGRGVEGAIAVVEATTSTRRRWQGGEGGWDFVLGRILVERQCQGGG